jgi:exopolysaccharide production protein ExoQ
MPPQVATVIFAIFVAGLFWLDRDSSVRPSRALWLSVLWLAQSGSRPVSVWLDIDPPAAEVAGQLPEPSQFNQFFAATLMLLGAIVLYRRRRLVTDLLKASWPVALYFSFALVSLLWSDFPAWGFKRWTRGLGDLIMVLIVATDAQPIAAVRRVFSRIGFVLLPASVLLINYYPEMGTDFDSGFNLGVTTNKNTLGDLVYLVALAALWQILSLINDRNESNRGRRLLAQCTLLAIAIHLLFMAQCATAVACIILGAALMLYTSLPLFRRRPAAVHVLVVGILLVVGLINFGGSGFIMEALGRHSNLTGRDRIWTILKPIVPNPIGGAGFETFWVGPRVYRIWKMVGGPHMTNESHNGYIETYLNLGLVGLGLIALILGQGYYKAVAVFRRDSALGALLVAYVVTAVAYNYSEAGFRILSLEWICLLLSVVAANRIICMAGIQAVSTGNDRLDQPSFDAPLPIWWGSTANSSRSPE